MSVQMMDVVLEPGRGQVDSVVTVASLDELDVFVNRRTVINDGQISPASPRQRRRRDLLGRASECAMLDGLVSDIGRGEGRSVVLRGEAGMGKTALLEYLIESAGDISVLRAVGMESEMELAYASLQQLCAPLLDRLPQLVAPQGQALEIVFGLRDGTAPDRLLVGLGVLSLLSAAAADRPLLCIVDDAQWLDQASASTLAFVARRLGAEAIRIVLAARERVTELSDLPHVEIRGLRNGHAQSLLSSAVPFKLDERVRDRIIAETRGNPSALLELPNGLTASELAGGFGSTGVRSLSGRIEASFVRRLEGLSEDGRTLLLVAAAEPTGDPGLLVRACGQLGIGIGLIDAETDGLLTLGDQVTFRHPLVRSAVYRSAGAEQRQAVHRALAEVTDEANDPDRRAWHRAAATTGSDEGVACELEHSAERALARGGLAAAAAFWERSASLSVDPARRTERALQAARASLSAGALDAVRAQLVLAEAGPLDELQNARVELLRAQLVFASSHGADAPTSLLRVAKRLEPLDVDLARETYLNALSAAILAGRAAGPGANFVDVSRAALTAPPPPHPPRGHDLLLDGLATLSVEGRAAGVPILTRALHALTDDAAPVDVCRCLFPATAAAVQLWDDEMWHALCERYVELGREAGALSEIPLALTVRVYVHLFCGELDAAESLIAELRMVTDGTESFLASSCMLHLAAMRGREPAVLAQVRAAGGEMTRRGQGGGSALSEVATAVLCNGLGRYDEALAAAQAVGPQDLATENWAMAERVEAAVRAGKPEVVADTNQRLQEMAQATRTEWGLGIAARCGALLGEGDPAEILYREAIDRLARTRLRPDLARAHLLYGEWLRREGRRVDARGQLRMALEHFVSTGMEAFAERTRRELLATGEKARKRTVETRDDLTPQERQIAELARDGLSNPEIGARLFLSPRTVEWHLRKVFGKLGIGSRHQLADALATVDAELVQG